MRKLFFNRWALLALCFVGFPVSAEGLVRWYLQQGKGRPLCEGLVHIANANPPIGITPNIPWEQVLAIKGVREPEWTELDLAKHENFFLMARNLMATYVQYLNDEQVMSFPWWFKAPKERYVPELSGATPMSDEAALEIYRHFVRRGGKLKVLRHNMGGKAYLIPKDIVQYESPEKDFSEWDGYSLEATPGLSAIPDDGYHFTELGRGYRVLRYNNNLFSFVGFRRGYGEYRVALLGGEFKMREEEIQHGGWHGYCKINSEIIKRGRGK